MYRIGLLSCLLVLLIFSGCEKRKARNTIKGSWQIVGYTTTLPNSCTGEMETESDFGGDFGTAEFTRKDFSIDYNLYPDSIKACYDRTTSAFEGDFEIVDHSRVFVSLHEYKIDLDGEEWTMLFGASERADDQDIVTLSTNALTADNILSAFGLSAESEGIIINMERIN